MGTDFEDYDHEALRTYFVEQGLALGSGDLEAVADRFDAAAVLVLAEETVALQSPEQVHDLLREHAGAPDPGDAVALVPEVTDSAELGWALLWVEVRWSLRDELAAERASRHVRYLLRRARGTFEVCVVVPLP
ncbi:hypothetical protein [Isoptericola haloaureus]|uniref:Uncharacterized protein n=1 Tax=Isoptericola haloaureus TaxID=1542902 RepID=A0ABU7Z326_9MICO